MTDFTDIAIKKALQSTCRFRVSCLAFNDKGDLIGSFFNQHRICSKGQSIHAEIAAIWKLGRKIKTLVLCRVNKKGKLLPIHPCSSCAKMTERFGIDIKTIEKDKV
jgi:cytidine deaminase